METTPSILGFLRLIRPTVLVAALVGVAAAAPKVAVLVGDSVSPFGQVLVSGFREAATQAGIELTLKSPPTAENVAQSQKLIASWENDPDLRGLIIACGIGAPELAKAAEPFRLRGLPVVAILGRMPAGVAKSSVLIDENTVIATAVEHIARLVGPTDEIALLRSNIRQEAANARERLAIEGLRQRYPALTIHADVFMNFEGSTPQAQAKLLLEKYPRTKLVYSPYSSATLAMIGALRETARAGKIRHVGIGAGLAKDCAEAIQAGELDVLIALDPQDVAHKAVATMTALLAGKDVPEIVFSQVKVITRETVAATSPSAGK